MIYSLVDSERIDEPESMPQLISESNLMEQHSPRLCIDTKPPSTSEPASTKADQTLDQLTALSDQLARLDSANSNAVSLQFELPSDFVASIVIPVYNEVQTIDRVIARVQALPLPTQVIVVDDHSIDGTGELLRRLEKRTNIEVIYKPTNEGKGAALRAGFSRASGDVVVVQDADLEYNPLDIPRLLRPIACGEADVVYGSRFLTRKPDGFSRLHRLANGLLTWSSNMATGLQLTDMETCYKLFRRSVLDGVALRQNRFGFEPEVTAKIARRGYRIRELPIEYRPRTWDEGKKIGIRDAVNAIFCIARYALAD